MIRTTSRINRGAGLLVAFALAVSMLQFFAAPKASAATYATYRTTDDIGRRNAPTAKPNGQYGIPKGASFNVECQVIGEPHGNYGNKLYFLTNYNGMTYVPDAWTDSPHLAKDPPIAGIPMCGASQPAPAPQPAPNGSTYASRDRQLRLCTNTGNGACVPSGMPTVSSGARVSMVCWQKGSNDTGDYTTDMWFWITSPRGEGYVSASVIRNQTNVPACSSNKRFVAAETALARMGQRSASTADRQQFNDSEWKPGPVGEWAGDCPKLPYVAWRAAGVTIPKSNAINNYKTWANRNGGSLPKSSPPRGAVVFWDIAKPYGHTAIALGNGFVATTVGMDGDNAANTVRTYGSYGSYLGWALPA